MPESLDPCTKTRICAAPPLLRYFGRAATMHLDSLALSLSSWESSRYYGNVRSKNGGAGHHL